MQFFKSKKFIVVLVLVLAGGIYFLTQPSSSTTENPQNQSKQEESSDKIRLVSTNPEGMLTGSPIILPTQTIEITFNQPIVNRDELRRKLSPEVQYEINLINDRKTAVIKPTIAYPAGTEFSLILQGNSKFDTKEGQKEIGDEYILHFKTIEHKGI